MSILGSAARFAAEAVEWVDDRRKDATDAVGISVPTVPRMYPPWEWTWGGKTGEAVDEAVELAENAVDLSQFLLDGILWATRHPDTAALYAGATIVVLASAVALGYNASRRIGERIGDMILYRIDEGEWYVAKAKR